MTLHVRLTAEAVSEIEDATHWYEQRHDGLGLAFVAAVDRTVDSAQRWPRAGAPVDGIAEELNVRRARVERFPYYVAYLVSEDTLFILAIAHERRRPLYWIERVEL